MKIGWKISICKKCRKLWWLIFDKMWWLRVHFAVLAIYDTITRKPILKSQCYHSFGLIAFSGLCSPSVPSSSQDSVGPTDWHSRVQPHTTPTQFRRPLFRIELNKGPPGRPWAPDLAYNFGFFVECRALPPLSPPLLCILSRPLPFACLSPV